MEQNRELTFTRIVDAPRELVFKAWTKPELLAQWWGPRGFTNPICEADARVNGKIHIDMTGSDGTVFPMNGTFREIVPSEKLVFTTDAGMYDENGEPTLQNINTVTFEEFKGITKIVVHVVVVKAAPQMAEALSGMEQGWSESLYKLADTLSTL